MARKSCHSPLCCVTKLTHPEKMCPSLFRDVNWPKRRDAYKLWGIVCYLFQ
ncbi:hypothetical protein ALQ33_102234 [Pseudomonas syringae pv. philadelphi]|uniref:Uncharacterized protein n=1 Tax=Pseudomonas syringae pv. philadelphi TaxID=251706 RepID=A0A3M3ZUQ6_9PSED|nr:hypothetical protein ALQ33_102234 [Pseudomonas syringae pv. philadelphi]